jgi:hypothetical protein
MQIWIWLYTGIQDNELSHINITYGFITYFLSTVSAAYAIQILGNGNC